MNHLDKTQWFICPSKHIAESCIAFGKPASHAADNSAIDISIASTAVDHVAPQIYHIAFVFAKTIILLFWLLQLFCCCFAGVYDETANYMLVIKETQLKTRKRLHELREMYSTESSEGATPVLPVASDAEGNFKPTTPVFRIVW
jgi:hypothetical protein